MSRLDELAGLPPGSGKGLTTCDVCGQQFPTMAELVVHVAKRHRATSTDMIGGTYSDSVLDYPDEYGR